ncbi:MAG: glycosyltransferase family 4 protein, partial [Deltaproteobacteria bacterium]|nr:glycosyltransferase family 4 protein [Deltaproteobacteria bacterium]
FMPQKGFNYLIDTMDLLEKEYNVESDYKVLAVGSGDYLQYYKRTIKEKRLIHRFVFIPFQRKIGKVYKAVDLVVMPSVWEAFGLQAAEAMCMGKPIIVTNCIGLREAVKGTPAIVVQSKDALGLSKAIYSAIISPPVDRFREFQNEAIERYDVRPTSKKLQEVFECFC